MFADADLNTQTLPQVEILDVEGKVVGAENSEEEEEAPAAEP